MTLEPGESLDPTSGEAKAGEPTPRIRRKKKIWEVRVVPKEGEGTCFFLNPKGTETSIHTARSAGGGGYRKTETKTPSGFGNPQKAVVWTEIGITTKPGERKQFQRNPVDACGQYREKGTQTLSDELQKKKEGGRERSSGGCPKNIVRNSI